MTPIKVVVLMVKKRASRKHQEALKRVLKKYGFDPKGSFIFVIKDGRQSFFLQGISSRVRAEQICREVLDSIN